MIMLYWNVRGIGNVDTKIALKNLFTFHRRLLIFVAKPMIAFESVPPWYWDSIGLSKYCVNSRENLQPNLWALLGSGVSATVMFIFDQCIALEISCHQSIVYVVVVYTTLLNCIPTHCSSQVSDIYLAAVLHTVHIIWLARNAFRFQSQLQSIHSANVRIHSLIAMSDNVSTGKCLPSDSAFLEDFSISSHHHKYKEITSPWLKVNTNGSVVGGLAAYGGLFRDSLGTFLGAFSCNIGIASVFHAETLAFILAIDHAAQHGWRNLWLESDSTSALMIFFELCLSDESIN